MGQAERFLREALERDGEDVSALSMLSEVLRAKGDLVGAVAAAQRATEVGGAEGKTPGALAQAPGHMTAPDLVKVVRTRAPGVGRASVYRTLVLLMELGLVQSSTLGGVAATYMLTPSKHHHHIVCIE